ncbi:LysE family translocator [Pseudanabaena sp. PCC 6802]|uniref:LysE family translocator n=1 Tax=Pseudanabaena sp. PCC 6802 TaxID=118173 RepID=UPI00034B6683|nr:LysE family translocator [Pseudanabaena sp. PCC 6802]
MPDTTTFLIFLTAAITLIMTPGPNTLYVTTRSMELGQKAGLVAAFGVGVGCLIHTSAAAFGLSALLMSSDFAYEVVKYLGAGYLVYLGVRTVWEHKKVLVSSAVRKIDSLGIFGESILTSLLNPKIALFFIAFLPQFTNPDIPLMGQIFLLGSVYSILCTGWYVILGLLLGSTSTWFMNQLSLTRIRSWITGCILVALGLSIALPLHILPEHV